MKVSLNNLVSLFDKRAVYDSLLSVLSISLFFGIWEGVSRSSIVNPLLFPPPTLVAVAFAKWITEGNFFLDVLMSISRVFVGFTAGTVLGVVTGIFTGKYKIISNILSPVFQLLRPIPPIAFVPIVILWFGLSELGKWFLVFWGVFFTVWLATHYGVQRADKNLIRAAQCLGTPERYMMQEVLFPSALPYIMVGLRSSISISFYTLVAAELAGTFSGIAYRIDISQQNLQIGQSIAGLVVLGFISAIADRLFVFLSKKTVWWGS